jgi:hypothetical protein
MIDRIPAGYSAPPGTLRQPAVGPHFITGRSTSQDWRHAAVRTLAVVIPERIVAPTGPFSRAKLAVEEAPYIVENSGHPR